MAFPRLPGSSSAETEDVVLRRKDALSHRQKYIDAMLEEVFVKEAADDIKVSIGSKKRGQTTHASGRASPVNIAVNLLEQTARTCQSYDFTAGTTEQTKSTISNARHLNAVHGPLDAAELINTSRDQARIGGTRGHSRPGPSRVLSRLDDERRYVGASTLVSKPKELALPRSTKPWKPSVTRKFVEEQMVAVDGRNPALNGLSVHGLSVALFSMGGS